MWPKHISGKIKYYIIRPILWHTASVSMTAILMAHCGLRKLKTKINSGISGTCIQVTFLKLINMWRVLCNLINKLIFIAKKFEIRFTHIEYFIYNFRRNRFLYIEEIFTSTEFLKFIYILCEIMHTRIILRLQHQLLETTIECDQFLWSLRKWMCQLKMHSLEQIKQKPGIILFKCRM